MGMHVSDRIRDALATPMASADLCTLWHEATAERDRMEGDAQAALKTANDPRAKASEADEAKRKHDDLTFRVGRMRAAISELDVVIDRVQERERQDHLRAQHDAAREAQRAMVDEVRTRYPQLAADLADLLERMAAVERQVHAANAKSPAGATRIPSVEFTVRGIGNHVADQVPALYNAVRLPHLDKDAAARGLLHRGSTDWSLSA